MGMSSFLTLSKLTGTDDFCSVAENSIKNHTAKGQLYPGVTEGPVMQYGLRKDDGPFLSKQTPPSMREKICHTESFVIQPARLSFCSLAIN